MVEYRTRPLSRKSMPPEVKTRVTRILTGPIAGSSDASPEALLPLVYEELRGLAAGYLRKQPARATLQATSLVHEAYERLVDQSRVNWQGRTHFFCVAAHAMRRLLADHARRRNRMKRGGDWRRVTLEGAVGSSTEPGFDQEDFLALDRAIRKLAHLDERQARCVELRFFSGMDMDRIADALGISRRSAERDWTHARAWLRRELADSLP